MTTEPTGRELDAWLAEHVMGWVSVVRSHPLSDNEWVGDRPGEHRVTPLRVPHYSTDLTAAMQLAEKMMKDGYTITLAMNGMPEYTLQGYRYFCCIGKLVKDQKEAGSQESLPEAIALAAFRALRGGDDA